MEMRQPSATAQREGEEKKISETVRLPLPRNASSLRFGCSALSSFRIGPALKIALSPRSGAEPWQLTPLMTTSISMRPRCPR